MGRATTQRLTEIKIILVFTALFLLAFDHFGGDQSRPFKLVTHQIAGRFRLIEVFRQNVACPLQGFVHRPDLSLYEGGRTLFHPLFLLP